MSVTHPKQSGSLSITSYNIQMTPFHATNQRLLHIVKELQDTHTDIICLQECFLQCVVDLLVDLLKHCGYVYSARDSENRNFMSSGLLILSKYPLEHVRCTVYTSSSFIDALSDKAFMSCTVIAPTHQFRLVNTHLQSDYPFLKYTKIRCRQIQQLVKQLFQNDVSTDKNELDIILCGDFNIDKNTNEYAHTLCSLRQNTSQYGCSTHVYRTPKLAYTFGTNELLDHFFLIARRHSVYATKQVRISNTFTHSDHKMITLG